MLLELGLIFEFIWLDLEERKKSAIYEKNTIKKGDVASITYSNTIFFFFLILKKENGKIICYKD